MTTLPRIIDGPWPLPLPDGPRIELEVERTTLAKRRWRGVARDGAEFGFDLETPLADGAAFFAGPEGVYAITQKPEPVLEILLGEPVRAAQVAWSLGNLHFPIEIAHEVIRVADDAAVRLYLERDGIPYAPLLETFHPIKAAGHGHGHAH
jgi:urease accessory protein